MAYLSRSLRDTVARTRELARDRDQVQRRAVRSDAADLEAGAPHLQVPWSVRVVAEWSWRSLVIAAAAAMAIALAFQLRHVVIPVLLAIVITVLLSPATGWLHRVLRFPRALAALTTILATLAFVVGIGAVAGRSIASGFTDLAAQARVDANLADLADLDRPMGQA